MIIYTLIKTISWGVVSSIYAQIVSKLLKFNKEEIRNITISAFILGCIRGYTDKNIITLLLQT